MRYSETRDGYNMAIGQLAISKHGEIIPQ